MKKENIASGLFTRNSINDLVSFYEDNKNDLNSVLQEMKIDGSLEYPQMKLLDMGFWQLGYELTPDNAGKKGPFSVTK